MSTSRLPPGCRAECVVTLSSGTFLAPTGIATRYWEASGQVIPMGWAQRRFLDGLNSRNG